MEIHSQLKPKTMKTILVPTDFSGNADNALNYAIHLAGKDRAKIILVHSSLVDSFKIIIGNLLGIPL